MKKQIIAVIDTDKVNEALIDYTYNIAEEFDLSILLYSIQYTPTPLMATTGSYSGVGFNPYEMQRELEARARKKLMEITARARRKWPSIAAEHEVGFLADTVVDKSRWVIKQARERDAFLIVVQKEHEYNWWNELLGTSETKIAQKSPCPVLIVPEESKYKRISRVMYLIDSGNLRSENLPNVQWLTHFSQKFDAALALAYLPEEDEQLSKTELEIKMNALRDRMPFRKFFYYQFTPENTTEEMIRVAEISHTDILAFSYQSESFFRYLFDNDNTRALILKASLPVLVF